MGAPPGADLVGFASTAWALADLGRIVAESAGPVSGANQGGFVADAGGPQIPGLSNAGGGGFFSPALRLAMETGCDVCTDTNWELLRTLLGLVRSTSTQVAAGNKAKAKTSQQRDTPKRGAKGGIQFGVQGQIIAKGLLSRAYQGGVGIYIGNDGWGIYYSYATSGEGWMGGLGLTVSGYSGADPGGVVNNFQAQLGIGLGYSYDDNINILSPTAGIAGPGLGVAITRDRTIATCLLFCGGK